MDDATDGKRVKEDRRIHGSTTAELLANTRKFFETCVQVGITLNLQKVQWHHPEVLFGRFLLDSTGYKIDPSLTEPRWLRGLIEHNQSLALS